MPRVLISHSVESSVEFQTRIRIPCGRLKKLLVANRADLKVFVVNEMESLCEISFPQYTEKRVDVSIAVDMVRMAYEDKYDVAYPLSADGDFVPIVEAVRLRWKKVFVALPVVGYELKKAAG